MMIFEEYFPQIVKSGIVLITLFVLRWSLVFTVKRVAKKSERLEHRTGLIVKLISYLIIFFLIIGFIFIWGVQIKDLGLVMSSVFAVIGIGFFAQWSILSNITSGVIMFFTFPYKIGDYIKIHDKEFPFEGFIEDIKTFHIVLRTHQHEEVTYPNSMMLQKGVTVIKPEDFTEMEARLEEEDKNVTEQAVD